MSTTSALLLTLALAANSDTVLLEFTAEWCGPCRVMEPTIQRLVSAGYPLRKIDVDRDARIAERFRVTGVPCFVMLVDGQEVDRISGAVSHGRLVQMYEQARVVATRRDTRAPQNFASGGEVFRGQSPEGSSPATRAAQPAFPSSGLTRTPPTQARSPRALPQMPPAAAPNGARAGVDPSAVRTAFQATVRLRVEDPQGHGLGSGTIIDAHGSEALVVTCGHLFRESAGKGKIEVDLFDQGQARTVPGQLITYDLDRDIALVSIAPGQHVTPIRVSPSGDGIARGNPVFSIGCDKGAAPSVRESRITAIDKYLGPPNIEVAGQPVDGRSGGGLFTGDGRLIGICNAADPADNEGIYASLPTIHWELDRIGQRRIYAAPGGPLLSQAAAASAAPRQPLAHGNAPPTMPDRMVMPAVANQLQPVAGRLAPSDPDTEVICIIRSRRHPQGEQRLLVLDHPSADLLARLRQESRPGAAAASIARQPSVPRRNQTNPVVRAQSADP